ncbi:MAG: hypothetical protein A4S14_01200 [Proteobacteria bacterium SG_bin9]|nr:MAG: hypothetical protein A4S14_01200 [Proteobacteria bacterium SG_bin9]
MAETATAQAGRNDQLDGLRGYAALAVVFWHAMLSADPANDKIRATPLSQLSNWPDIGAKLALSILNGQTAVILFFVLSGAVLINSLQREQGSAFDISWRFVVRRFFRIYPALFLAIGLTASALAFWRHVGAREIFENLVLYDWAIVGPSWSLHVEFIAVLFILPVFFAYRRFGEIGMLAMIVVIIVAINTPLFKTSLSTAKPYVFAFAAGMLIPTPTGAFFGSRLPVWIWPVALLVAMFTRNVAPIGLRASLITEAVAAGIFVLLLYYRRAGSIGRFLERPSSNFLGRISFSLYLLNVPFLIPLDLYAPVAYPILTGLAYAALICVVVMPLSYLALMYVEKPGIVLGRALTAPKAQPVPAQRA